MLNDIHINPKTTLETVHGTTWLFSSLIKGECLERKSAKMYQFLQHNFKYLVIQQEVSRFHNKQGTVSAT